MSAQTGYTAEKVFHEHAQMTRECNCIACSAWRENLNQRELTRLRAIEAAAREVMNTYFPNQSFDELPAFDPIAKLRLALSGGEGNHKAKGSGGGNG